MYLYVCKCFQMRRKQNLKMSAKKCSGGLPAGLRILRACYRMYLQKINLNTACFILIVYKVESISDSDYSFSQQLQAEQKQVGLTPSLPCPGEAEGAGTSAERSSAQPRHWGTHGARNRVLAVIGIDPARDPWYFVCRMHTCTCLTVCCTTSCLYFCLL